ncbi:universal stress protein [Gordonia sp. UCD-TK1]|uniref:universal stress protein n=1 Tax=Gordonia sp. UCD-TK1 TaxID=1857893 RepID=UPI000A5F035B|nr:universal stress protein [Gordonia sp. UCD-TK1]
MNTIAVGVDLSPESEAAAHWAAASARDGDRLLLIHGFAAALRCNHSASSNSTSTSPPRGKQLPPT